jgi:two-component SAPR family response regulator
MSIEIKKPLTKEKVNKAMIRISKEGEKKSLQKHFGKLKRDFDGTEYQKKVRNVWA